MIDLALLRTDYQTTAQKILAKDPHYNVQKLFELDKQVRELTLSIEKKQTQKNALAAQARTGFTEAMRDESKQLSSSIKEEETLLESVSAEFRDLYLRCPNIPFDDLPHGGKEANKVVRTIGAQPTCPGSGRSVM